LDILVRAKAYIFISDDCSYFRKLYEKTQKTGLKLIGIAKVQREFEVPLRVDVKNAKGVLAKVASSITFLRCKYYAR
jgi:(p)ppGpp synthase/HD superfamily hydrolase